ncbi:phosphoribosylformylglycinamidine cyclo-ligase [Luteolibacter luteus]|uniref:Phosphoribosylformylglycinamidine cyclo-ligase n=1 Tax=Luteolibacter luteus TaxID=2728835 RepID=A0A858RGJ4_9BACT|nr:phosphoribosylformylglycinamidine cyclo-ligase [Luteolibacter luteus]QJE95549.1 phosphoribosylformylglycinamidine cyclo-ligase [Luteolibacter luteus]
MGGKLTYQQAGVDTRRAAALVGDIKSHVARTQQNRKLLGAFGLFAACYDLSSYKEPVIVTGCDGVGTKLELLLEHDLLEIAGKDLVAMSVNDILTTGGDPLLFLDYIGIAALDEEKITRLIAGMCDYLASCDCILAGGETAEMPGIVPADVIELSGFCIGCAEKPELVDPSTLQVGDVLVGYKSDSIHANGWSLVRRVLRENPGCVSDDELLGFLEPTRLYHDVVRDIRAAGVKPKAFAHITGGGLPENLERLFRGFGADLEIPKWELPGIDKLLAHVDSEDRFHTFNMGIGWVAIVSPDQAEAILSAGPGGTILGTLVDTEGVRVKVRGE